MVIHGNKILVVEKKKNNNNINNNKEASTLNSNKFYSFKKTVSHNSQ